MVRYLALGVAVAAQFAAYRKWHLHWGATAFEARARLPGDEMILDPSFAPTRAITIEATPEEIWPWIVQIGYGRAGFYSYDLLDNFGRPSAETILTEWQSIEIGDIAAPMSPFDDPPSEATAFVVAGYEKDRWLLWAQPVSTWIWCLEPVDQQTTRVITRVRCKYNWPHPQAALSLVLMELADFPMMRKQLLGLKRRVEQYAPTAVREHRPAAKAI
jgi:hypothetical protein